MADANLQDRDAVRDVAMVDKVTRRTLNHGDRMSLHEVTIKKGGVVPLHDHPHEQIGYLSSGRALFTIGNLQREIKQGDSWIIPGGLPHEVTALEDSVAIDVFSPVREEYLD